MRVSRLAAVALAAGMTVAAAPAPAPPQDPQGTLVANLVVRARQSGPAWWRVKSGGSTVWVLGVPAAVPKGLAWDQSVLNRRLARSRRLILPPTASFRLLDVFGAFGLAGKLRAPAAFEASLPPDLAQRYLAGVAALRQPPGRYDRWQPAVAGLLMVADFRRQAGLASNQPSGAIRAAASRAGVSAAPAIAYPAMPMMRGLAAELSDAVNLACLGDALNEIEAGAARVRIAAAAWAAGDVDGALGAERGYERCLAALPDGASLVRRTTGDETAAIARALRSGGEAVAVVELRTLLAHGGVLDGLRAQGFEVATPGAD
jgi:hypothetical protein